MRVPQVSERLKEVPARALRGVFAGIGQLLLFTDKLRNKAADVPKDRTPEAARTAPREAATQTAAHDADNERQVAAESTTAPTLRTATVAPTPAAAQAPKTPAAQAPKTPAAQAPEASKGPAARRTRDFDKTGNVRLIDDDDATARAAKASMAGPPAETGVAAEATGGSGAPDSVPPLPNYDELSVPSLRARLRNLDISQVRQVLDYEKAHAARPDAITMFERRIAKLEAEA